MFSHIMEYLAECKSTVGYLKFNFFFLLPMHVPIRSPISPSYVLSHASSFLQVIDTVLLNIAYKI